MHLGVILKRENKSDDMLDILKQIQGYAASVEDDNSKKYVQSIPVVGDQLTVEHGVNVIEAVQNSYTTETRWFTYGNS